MNSETLGNLKNLYVTYLFKGIINLKAFKAFIA